jgi:hypothetical protein
MIEDKIKEKFQSLLAEGNQIMSNAGWDGEQLHRTPSIVDFQRFKAEAMNIVKRACGTESVHYLEMKRLAEHQVLGRDSYCIKDYLGMLQAAQRDFEGGYLFNLELSITGELFGDFVNLSKTSLKEGHKDVAAVLACAALEDTLKRYARNQGLTVDDQVMQAVVSALKSKGLVSGAQKSLLDAMPKIRDYAMHANWQKITSEDVNSVIGFVEQFLLNHF